MPAPSSSWSRRSRRPGSCGIFAFAWRRVGRRSYRLRRREIILRMTIIVVGAIFGAPHIDPIEHQAQDLRLPMVELHQGFLDDRQRRLLALHDKDQTVHQRRQHHRVADRDHGRRIDETDLLGVYKLDIFSQSRRIRLFDESGAFLSLGRVDEEGSIIPYKPWIDPE